MAVDLQSLYAPLLTRLRTRVSELALFDAHTHLGRNDPDGYRQEPAELIAGLEACDARAVVFAMHEPDGYLDGVANDEVLAAAEASAGRLTPFCRVDPNAGERAVAEARRTLEAGARGIKLHPRGECFTLGHPMVTPLVALAHERSLPVLVHAGRGIPALGAHAIELAERFPQARLILAHAAISDLAWLWRELPSHPNVFVDTAWWNPVDVVALFTLAPPGQVLWASDSPYGAPAASAVQGLRCAIQAGLDGDQLRGVGGGQMARLVAGEAPLDLGPPPGAGALALDPTLERVVSHLCATAGRAFGRADHSETLALARLACAVSDSDPVAGLCRQVLELLDAFEGGWGPPPPGRGFPVSLQYLITALCIARTPLA